MMKETETDSSDFSGYSEDDIDSNRAYSLGNDDSGSDREQENAPDQAWKVSNRTARP